MTSSIYCIDTSTLVDLWKENGFYSKDVHSSLWRNIEDYIKNDRIVSSVEVFEELKKDNEVEFKAWLNENKKIFKEVDEDQIVNIKRILEKHEMLAEGFQGKADHVLVSLCLAHDYVLLTSEKASPTTASINKPKIPNLCEEFGVDCVNINTFCRRENIII